MMQTQPYLAPNPVGSPIPLLSPSLSYQSKQHPFFLPSGHPSRILPSFFSFLSITVGFYLSMFQGVGQLAATFPYLRICPWLALCVYQYNGSGPDPLRANIAQSTKNEGCWTKKHPGSDYVMMVGWVIKQSVFGLPPFPRTQPQIKPWR